MDQQTDTSLAKAAERLFALGRDMSALALLERVTPSALSRDQLRKLKLVAEEREDLDLALSMTRHLIVKLEGQKTEAELRELNEIIGSEIGALALLHNLPKPETPIQPVAGRLAYVLHHSLPFFSNGYATRGHGMAMGMQAAGLDVICVTRPGFPLDIKRDLTDAPAQNSIDTVTYHRIAEPKWTGPGRSKTYATDAADALEEAFREHRPQAVIAASNHVNALPALIAARRCGIPMAYEVRGFWEITNASRDPAAEKSMAHQLKIRLDAKLAVMADQVFTLSHSMKDELIRRKVPASKIVLLPNCCDPDIFIPRAPDTALAAQYGLPDDVPVIGYIGSFVDYEGLDDLTRACATLRREGHIFRLVLVGAPEGAIHDRITKIAETEGLGDWLILPGRVPHDQVEAWYSLIDIAPFPRKPVAVTELVTPLKPLEAMAMEKAVVMSSVAAMAEMVEDGVTGLVFEKGSPPALAAVLARMLEDADLRHSLGQRARTFVKSERTWVKMGKRVLQWSNSIAAENKG
jgi:glycosyltransferase involved in cell wall biosynthesis